MQMSRIHRTRLITLAALIALLPLVIGCGDGLDRVSMSGTVRKRPEDYSAVSAAAKQQYNRVFNTVTIIRPIGTKICKFISDYTGSKYWGDYVSNLDNTAPLISAHPGGVQGLFADGSVHFINETIELATLQALAIRDSGVTKEWEE